MYFDNGTIPTWMCLKKFKNTKLVYDFSELNFLTELFFFLISKASVKGIEIVPM